MPSTPKFPLSSSKSHTQRLAWCDSICHPLSLFIVRSSSITVSHESNSCVVLCCCQIYRSIVQNRHCFETCHWNQSQGKSFSISHLPTELNPSLRITAKLPLGDELLCWNNASIPHYNNPCIAHFDALCLSMCLWLEPWELTKDVTCLWLYISPLPFHSLLMYFLCQYFFQGTVTLGITFLSSLDLVEPCFEACIIC